MSNARGLLRRVALIGPAAALLSCRAVDGPKPAAVIDGSWQYTETLTDNLYGVTCADTGQYTFTQAGGKFTGTYVQSGKCHSGGSSFWNTGHGLITNGTVTSVQLQFTASDLCTYSGLLTSTRDAVHGGSGLCEFVDSASARHYSLQIDWEMTR